MNVLADRVASRFAHRMRQADIPVGTTHENGTVRIHRYRDVLMVWDLSTAGKRGKKVRKMSIIPKTGSETEREGLLDRLGKMLDSYSRYDQVAGTIQDYLHDYPDDLEVHYNEERGVDVMPAGFQPIVVKGNHVRIEAEYKTFTVKNTDDKFNEPTCIPAISGGLKSIPVFYRWVKDNEQKIKDMTFNDVVRAMSALDIRFHQYCAID